LLRGVTGADALVYKYYLREPPRRGVRPGRLGGAGSARYSRVQGLEQALAGGAGVLRDIPEL
jgi:hypothetical protein